MASGRGRWSARRSPVQLRQSAREGEDAERPRPRVDQRRARRRARWLPSSIRRPRAGRARRGSPARPRRATRKASVTLARRSAGCKVACRSVARARRSRSGRDLQPRTRRHRPGEPCRLVVAALPQADAARAEPAPRSSTSSTTSSGKRERGHPPRHREREAPPAAELQRVDHVADRSLVHEGGAHRPKVGRQLRADAAPGGELSRGLRGPRVPAPITAGEREGPRPGPAGAADRPIRLLPRHRRATGHALRCEHQVEQPGPRARRAATGASCPGAPLRAPPSWPRAAPRGPTSARRPRRPAGGASRRRRPRGRPASAAPASSGFRPASRPGPEPR